MSRISTNTLEVIQTLWDIIRDGDEDDPARSLATEISKLPDLDGSKATAGYFVTSDGDILHNRWWVVLDDGSVFDAAHPSGPVQCSKKDPRHKQYIPYEANGQFPLKVLQLADHLKSLRRVEKNKTFTEMLGEWSQTAYVQPEEAVSQKDLDAIEVYADRLFQKVGIDVAFSRHFLSRVNDPRNQPSITPAELIRMFKQQYRKHGKRIPRLGPDAEAVLRDMATDVNVPFVLKWDQRSGMLDLLSKTIMRKKNFGTADPVFAIEDGKVVPSDAAQQASSMPGDMTVGGMPGVPEEERDDEVRPEDMQLGWDDLLDEVDHPEFMPDGDDSTGHDPTYDERRSQANPGHPAP